MTAIVETAGLVKRYDNTVAVGGVDLSIEEGEIFGLVGPNGAGKTTMLRMLATLLNGYRRGLYPLAHVAPLKWWSPPERSMLFFNELHIAKRLRRQMRQGHYTVTFDRDFDAVIKACAGHRTGRWRGFGEQTRRGQLRCRA